MRISLSAAFAAFLALFVFGDVKVAEAKYCTTTAACVADVQARVDRQDAASSAGRQWGPVSHSACAIASREQEGNERRCRSYDLKVGGKTREECAKCYRQVREDLARWEQCYREGYAPKPPRAIYESLARLGKDAE